MTRAGIVLLLVPLAAQAQLALFVVNGTTETAVEATYQAGTIAAGATLEIRFRARNSGTVPVTVTGGELGVSGMGFTIVKTPSPPFVIAPGAFQDTYVDFAGASPASYSAHFQIHGISVTSWRPW